MKLLGISGSPRKNEQSGVYTLVKTVLENTGIDYDLISLRKKTISGCIACLGCVKHNTCKVEDDMKELRPLIVDADAFVIGAPNYYGTLNATTHAFLERWFQFRHQEGNTLWGKLGVTVGVGGTAGDMPASAIEQFLSYNFIETIANVHGQGAASCYSCGFGETCKVGIPSMIHGEGFTMSEELIPSVTKQTDVMESAVQAGKLLASRLSEGHDRDTVTEKMHQAMMEKFGETM